MSSTPLGRGTAYHDRVTHNVLYLAEVVFGEIELCRRSCAFDLVWPPRPDYGDVHGRVGERPGDRKLGYGVPPFLGELLQLLDRLQVLAEVLAPEEIALAAPVAFRELLVRAHLAGEQAVGQWAVDEHPYAMLDAIGEYLFLDVAPEEVVGWLQAVDLAGTLELGHLGRVEVRDADVPDFAFFDHLIQEPGDLLERSVMIRPVHLIEVYVVGPEKAQTVLETLPEPLGTRVTRPATLLP